MRKNLIAGILKENKSEWERRTPLTPQDVKWLIGKGIKVEVESNPLRIFSDDRYRRAGARIVDRIQKASLLVGIKEPSVGDVMPGRIYMVFSHTVKGQKNNMPLLAEFIKKGDTLIDYEKITDTSGKRLIYFGKFAGICGMVDSLYYMGRKMSGKGIVNPFSGIKAAWEYRSLKELKKDMAKVGRNVRRKGFGRKLSPFIVGVTGHGNVSSGVQEVLESLHAIEIHPRDVGRLSRYHKFKRNRIYKIIFLREEKLRAKKGEGFYFEDYLKHPNRFESNLDRYLSYLNMLIHTSYWDRRYPRMVTTAMVRKLYRRKDFRCSFIGDISCDVGGSIELTRRAMSRKRTVYTYDPKRDVYIDGYGTDGITILSVSNLPAELPKDSSEYFSGLIRDYVYQIAAHGARDVTEHTAVPAEIRRAVIAQKGNFTKDYRYLKKYLRRAV